jgi:hypothetical protein
MTIASVFFELRSLSAANGLAALPNVFIITTLATEIAGSLGHLRLAILVGTASSEESPRVRMPEHIGREVTVGDAVDGLRSDGNHACRPALIVACDGQEFPGIIRRTCLGSACADRRHHHYNHEQQ